MTNVVKLREPQFSMAFRWGWRLSAMALASSMVAPALALAHGGMGPNEIGPPIVTSGLLGFAGYWAVMLWPSAKKKNDQEMKTGGQNPYGHRTDVRVQTRPVRVKRAPRLRKIEGRGQHGGEQHTRRKVSDG